MLKNVIGAIIFVSFISACKQKTDKATPKINLPDTTQLLIAKLKPILQGVWVKQDYIAKVISTRSPLMANDKVTGITTMHINFSGISSDGLRVAVTYDNEQAADVPLKFVPGQNKSAMPFGENELGYTILNGDTSLILYQLYNKQWFSTPYVKALPRSTGDNMQEGINFLINKNLIAGKYMLTDSLGNMSEVTFKTNGEVSGLGKFKRYFVENAFGLKAMNNLDQITFNIFSSDEKTYTFKIDRLTLNLFDIKPNITSTLLIPGKLKYKFVKVDKL